MHAVITHLLSHPGAQAAWIDTEGEFSPALLKEVIILRLPPSETCITAESVLDRVQIMRVLDIHGIVEVIDELKQTYKDKDAERALRGLNINDSEQQGSGGGYPETPKGDQEKLDDGSIGVVVVDTIYQPLSELMDSETGEFLDQDTWAFDNEKPESMTSLCDSPGPLLLVPFG